MKWVNFLFHHCDVLNKSTEGTSIWTRFHLMPVLTDKVLGIDDLTVIKFKDMYLNGFHISIIIAFYESFVSRRPIEMGDQSMIYNCNRKRSKEK